MQNSAYEEHQEFLQLRPSTFLGFNSHFKIISPPLRKFRLVCVTTVATTLRGWHQLLPSHALVQAKALLCVPCSIFLAESRLHCTPPDDLAVSRAIVPSLCLGPGLFPSSSANSWISHASPFSISPVTFHRDYKLACHWGVVIKVSAPIFLLRYLSKIPKHLTCSLQNCRFFSLQSPIE